MPDPGTAVATANLSAADAVADVDWGATAGAAKLASPPTLADAAAEGFDAVFVPAAPKVPASESAPDDAEVANGCGCALLVCAGSENNPGVDCDGVSPDEGAGADADEAEAAEKPATPPAPGCPAKGEAFLSPAGAASVLEVAPNAPPSVVGPEPKPENIAFGWLPEAAAPAPFPKAPCVDAPAEARVVENEGRAPLPAAPDAAVVGVAPVPAVAVRPGNPEEGADDAACDAAPNNPVPAAPDPVPKGPLGAEADAAPNTEPDGAKAGALAEAPNVPVVAAPVVAAPTADPDALCPNAPDGVVPNDKDPKPPAGVAPNVGPDVGAVGGTDAPPVDANGLGPPKAADDDEAAVAVPPPNTPIGKPDPGPDEAIVTLRAHGSQAWRLSGEDLPPLSRTSRARAGNESAPCSGAGRYYSSFVVAPEQRN